MDGALIIDKPAGLTSHDVIARVRHLLHERRIGHTGTLDPFATGVLIVLVGRATRLAQFLGNLEKEYEAVIRLGAATDTGDATGKPIELGTELKARHWSESELEAAMTGLRGEIQQVPPMYSAKKKSGRRLYELARQGEVVERQPVPVRISKFEAVTRTGDLLKDNLDGTFDFEVRVECSTGTYVRALAEDFGKALHTGAHLSELRRTRIGDFDLAQAQTLDQLQVAVAEEALGEVLMRPDEVLRRLPALDLNFDDLRRARHGLDIKLERSDFSQGDRVRLRDDQRHLVAVGTFDAERMTVHPNVVLNPQE